MMNLEIKKLKVVYFAILAGQLIFFAIIFLGLKPAYQPQTIYRIIAPILGLALITVAFYIYRQPLKKLEHLRRIEEENILDNTSVPLPKKEIQELFGQYVSYSIIRMAMVEFAVLIILVFYYFTGDYLLLFYFLLVLIVFGTTAPSIRQFARDYELTLSEEGALKRD